MKTLHLYLTRQVVTSLLMTLGVFAFVLLLGNVLKEILDLLVAGQVSGALVLRAIGLLVPYVMPFVLPFAMLTAVLLVFGRFSADQELTAVRASGISLISLTVPILLLSLLLCGVSAWFNLELSPLSRQAYKRIIFRLEARSIANLISEDRFIDEIPGIILYVRKKHGDELKDVRLYILEKQQIKSRMSAQSGLIRIDPAAHTIAFDLFDVVTEIRDEHDSKTNEQFIGPPSPEKPSDWISLQTGKYEHPPIDLTQLIKTERKPKLSEMPFKALEKEREDYASRGIGVMPVRVQLHRQLAFSFAPFAFTLVGIPLAIQAHRRETSSGVGIALALILVYHAFFVTAEALATHENLHPYLFVWIPNLLFQGVGAYLLYRANRR